MVLPAPYDSIEYALKSVKKEGTIIIYEGVESKKSTRLFDEFSEVASKKGYATILLEKRLVKAFKPHEYHVVLELLIKRK